jgi:hypothetical protein
LMLSREKNFSQKIPPIKNNSQTVSSTLLHP